MNTVNGSAATHDLGRTCNSGGFVELSSCEESRQAERANSGVDCFPDGGRLPDY